MRPMWAAGYRFFYVVAFLMALLHVNYHFLHFGSKIHRKDEGKCGETIANHHISVYLSSQ